MSFAATLRSLGARRAPFNTRSIRALHSPFGAMAPRATLSPVHAEHHINESLPRLNIVASAPIEKFNGVPLGAYQVSTPYYGSADAQAGNSAKNGEAVWNDGSRK
ncbi:hypothetical protein C8R44DRAFT_739148 [Mycena epipterygia]|nr:hypothetical protein C8R44DRAFT_739148 [Mycena epipterygia]